MHHRATEPFVEGRIDNFSPAHRASSKPALRSTECKRQVRFTLNGVPASSAICGKSSTLANLLEASGRKLLIGLARCAARQSPNG
jgi:hypothetical protein